jgi:hypothetical protein
LGIAHFRSEKNLSHSASAVTADTEKEGEGDSEDEEDKTDKEECDVETGRKERQYVIVPPSRDAEFGNKGSDVSISQK